MMFSTKSLFAATAALSLISSSAAIYNPSGKTNMVLYWGQGADQADLINYCRLPEIDVIVIGFVNTFPIAANGYVEQNFGNKCWGASAYKGPGYNGVKTPANDMLWTQCPTVQRDVPECQKLGKKMILSIGGAVNTWDPKTQTMTKTYAGQLKGQADGIYLANFLWKAYGPYDPAYTGPRPLDRGLSNTTTDKIDIDGFDFDIEGTAPGAGIDIARGETRAYVACIKRLRELMAIETAKSGKKYLITGAPQCYLTNGKEQNMEAVIYNGGFDLLFVQFYNNPSCSARGRANGTGKLNWNEWFAKVTDPNSASKDSKLYIGLLAGPLGTSDAMKNEYINAKEVQNLIATYGKNNRFAGIMLWDGRAGSLNKAADLNGKRYWTVVKEALYKNYPPKAKRDMLNHMQRHQHKFELSS